MGTKEFAVFGVFFCVVIVIFLYGSKRNKQERVERVIYVFTTGELEKVDEYTQFYLEQGLEIQSANLKAKQRVVSESK
jgi:hypothetical protein